MRGRRAPLAYFVSMMKSPLCFGGDGTSVVIPSPFLVWVPYSVVLAIPGSGILLFE